MKENRKYGLLIVLIAATALPLVLAVKVPEVWTVKTSALYASAWCGYAGMLLLIWMYVLGAKSVIGLFFTDIARIMRLHNWLGKYGTLLAFAHPLLIGVAYGENLLRYAFVPNISTEFEEHITYGRIALFAMLTIWLTSAIVRGAIKFRPWRYVHYLAYIALPLTLLHVPSVGSSYSSVPIARIYYVSILLVFIIFSVVRVRHLFGMGKATFEVVAQHETVPDVLVLKLKQVGGRTMSIRQGQYVYLQMNLLGEDHPFSVLSYDETNGEMFIAYKVYGRFTQKLRHLSAGTQLYVEGPYGNFTEELACRPSEPVVFVAGGIGVTPFMGHVMTDAPREQWLFYANRTHETAAFNRVLQGRLATRYVPVLSRQGGESVHNDERGHLSAEIFSRYLDQPNTYRYFICGPRPMVRSVLSALSSLGVHSDRIHTEAFGF